MKILFDAPNVSVKSTLGQGFLVPKSFLKLPFQKIKDDVLGKTYDLSIVLIGRYKAKKLNFKHRSKNYATDVLAFEISDGMGEIFICPEIAKIKSKKFGKTFENYLLFLVIHASLHLKGMEHSSKMDKYEFTIYSRYRHWHV